MFELTPEQQATLELADAFGRAELAPLAKRMDDEEWWPEDLWPKLGKAGLLGVTIPEADGGPGLDVFSSALVLQVTTWQVWWGMTAAATFALIPVVMLFLPRDDGRSVSGLAAGMARVSSTIRARRWHRCVSLPKASRPDDPATREDLRHHARTGRAPGRRTGRRRDRLRLLAIQPSRHCSGRGRSDRPAPARRGDPRRGVRRCGTGVGQ